LKSGKPGKIKNGKRPNGGTTVWSFSGGGGEQFKERVQEKKKGGSVQGDHKLSGGTQIRDEPKKALKIKLSLIRTNPLRPPERSPKGK